MSDPAPPPHDDPATPVAAAPLLSTYEMFQQLAAVLRTSRPPTHATTTGRP